MQRIVLLQILNEIPESPAENALHLPPEATNDSIVRTLDIHQERKLVEAFAFLASITNDPRKVIAVAIEEHQTGERLVVRIAANHGGLVTVQGGLQGMADILMRVARTG